MKAKFLNPVLLLITTLLLFATLSPPEARAQNTYAGGVSGRVTNNCLLKSNGPSSVTSGSICESSTAITTSLPVTNTGQIIGTKDPASTTNTAASLVINPATSAANELFIAALDNGSTVFSIDKEGDAVLLGGITLNTNKFTVASSTGNTAVAGTLGVTGDVAVNTNKFNVTASSGNTTVAGTLVVTGTMNGPFGAARVVGSTQVITAAMSGQLFAVNNASDAATVFTLPAASTAGLRYCFSADAVSGSNREVDVEPPAGSDLIIGTTTPAGGTGIATTAGAGHGIKNTHATAVRGNSVCVQSDGVNTWYMTSLSGIWASY